MRRLYGRLVIAFLIVILMTLCVLSSALFLILRRSPLEDQQTFAQLNAQALGIVTFLQNAPNPPTSLNEWQPLLNRMAESQGVRLAWVNQRGTVLFDSENRWQDQQLADIFRDRKMQTNGGWFGSAREGGRRWLTVGVRWQPGPNQQGEFLVATAQPRFPAMQRFRTTLLTPLLQAGVIALILSVILALIISRSIAHPLHQVAEAAQRMARGDLGARATITGPQEIRELANAFNDMGEKVQDSQQAQRDLVANVAHDLRTPLTSVQGFAQALVDGTASTPEAETQAARAIHEEAERMRQMTDTLLDLARLEAGEITLKEELIDLATLARKQAKHVRPLADDAGVHLEVQAAAPISVMGDTSRLAQVLDNLIGNALQHTNAGGKITIDVSQERSTAVLTVIDTGTGIPKDEQPRIFERFYRGDRARGGSSTGLGLAIVREIVNTHGGTVSVESVVGTGSQLTVRLPITKTAHEKKKAG